MTKSFIAVKTFLFEHVGFNRIEASHHPENPSLGKFMEKFEMGFEGIKRGSKG